MAKPYGNGVSTPIHPIDPQALEDAADRLELWLAFCAVHRPDRDHLASVSYEDHRISDEHLRLLLVDYRYHRPTQDAYDAACGAIEKQRERAEVAEQRVAELERRPRCGRADTIGEHVFGPCVLDHEHGGMHEEAIVAGHPGTRWSLSDEDDTHETIRRLTQERDEARRALQDPETFERLVHRSRLRHGRRNIQGGGL